MTGAGAEQWRPTVAVLSAVGAVLVLMLLAVALHRPDLVALAAPLAIGTAVHLMHRPTGALTARLAAPAGRVPEDAPVVLGLEVSAPPGTDLVTASVAPGANLVLDGAARVCAVPDTDGTVRIGFAAHPTRWGRTRSGQAVVSAWAGQGLLHRGGVARDAALTIVFGRERFTASDAIPLSAGVVGVHRSRRKGEGTDLAGVRPFVPGDRLKRINWPVSLRTDLLHVTATVTDLDTTVMIVVDSSIDAGAGDDATGGSLGVAVRAAASIAEHYLHAGDRVGLLDTHGSLALVAPGVGRRHLDRIVDVLVGADTTPTRAADALPVARALARIAPRSLVVLISPLIDQARPELAVGIARAGHPLIVVDALGDERPALVPDTTADLAWRLQRLQHRRDIDRLADLGIPVAPWRGAGSLDTVLRSLSRASAAPRARR